MLFERIEALLKSYETDHPVMHPTLLYNEGWMLRLILDRFASIDLSNESHPLAVPYGCRWYSEALLPSPFLAEYKGDPRAESWTHSDGVIGHFDIGHGAKGDLTIHPDATHFVVLEAKMYSKLTPRITNAAYYNQAARNVACIAEVLKRANRPPHDFSALGFYVLAPASQIKLGVFDKHLAKESIRSLVERRAKVYEGTRDSWFSDWFLPVLSRIDVRALSWEDLIDVLAERDPEAAELQDFYRRCLKYNMSSGKV